ncbi:MAG: alanine--glyoxylate aminotransferase family protein [Thaumarchaeota archaeon]|nr:alanine--glyoxylate aminotransferase family protein [Nitrososphaerota archaeon]
MLVRRSCEEALSKLLMIPGPSEPEPEVLSTLSLPILPHYGDKWKVLYDDTTSKLQKVFRTKNDVIIVPIPGQLTVEMAVANLVTPGQEAFVCANGLFTDMIITMIKFWGGKPIPIRSDVGSAVTPEQVAEVLESNKDPAGKALFVVHNETSTGVVNPAGEIFRVCKKHGVLTVLDAISGFGGLDVRADEWKTDYAIGYASKALGGVFGANPVAISPEAWETAKKNGDKIHTRYLNLNVWAKAIVEMGSWGHPHPSSMPTSIIVGLRKAVEIVLNEGLDNRYRRHQEVAKLTRDKLAEMGLELFPDKRYYSPTVTVPKVDPRWEKELRKQLVSRYDIMIGGGLGELTGKIVRIGHMGTTATIPKVTTTLTAMGAILKELRKEELIQR